MDYFCVASRSLLAISYSTNKIMKNLNNAAQIAIALNIPCAIYNI